MDGILTAMEGTAAGIFVCHRKKNDRQTHRAPLKTDRFLIVLGMSGWFEGEFSKFSTWWCGMYVVRPLGCLGLAQLKRVHLIWAYFVSSLFPHVSSNFASETKGPGLSGPTLRPRPPIAL